MPLPPAAGAIAFSPRRIFCPRSSRAARPIFSSGAPDFWPSYPQRGLVLVISDFLDDDDCEKPLQFLADFGHELILLQVWADEDREPPWEGELELEDAETGQHVELAFDAEARARYTAEFDEYASELERVALRNSGRYVGLHVGSAGAGDVRSLVRTGVFE